MVVTQVHATAHDVFPPIREREVIKSINIPVDEPNIEVLEDNTTTSEPPITQKSSFVAVSF